MILARVESEDSPIDRTAPVLRFGEMACAIATSFGEPFGNLCTRRHGGTGGAGSSRRKESSLHRAVSDRAVFSCLAGGPQLFFNPLPPWKKRAKTSN